MARASTRASKRGAPVDAEASPAKRFRRGVEEEESAFVDDPFANDDIALGDEAPMPLSTDGRPLRYVCQNAGCDFRADRPVKLKDHVRTHTGERPFACDECDKTFPRKDHLSRHKRNHHAEAEPPRTFVCEWEGCGKSFATKDRVANHAKVHENKLYCTYPGCSESFRKQNTLDKHLAQHQDKMPFPCTYIDEETGDQCRKAFKSLFGLRGHFFRNHAVVKSQAYMCIMCAAPGTGFKELETANGVLKVAKEGLSFESYEDFAEHNREKHPPYCATCHRTFANSYSLRMHFQVAHVEPEKVPQYRCAITNCDKVFTTESNMKSHVDTVHLQKKKFVCHPDSFVDSKKPDLMAWNGTGPDEESKGCGAIFSARSSLESHVRRYHIDFKNRKQARLAKKAARKASGVTQAPPSPSDLRILTGAGFDGGRNVPCTEPECDYRFFQTRDLRRHLVGSVHKFTKELTEEKILEQLEIRALEGGDFWVGGLDADKIVGRHNDDLTSAATSMPQTPEPFQEPPMIHSPSGVIYKPSYDYEEVDEHDYEEDEVDEATGLHHLQAYNMSYGQPPDLST